MRERHASCGWCSEPGGPLRCAVACCRLGPRAWSADQSAVCKLLLPLTPTHPPTHPHPHTHTRALRSLGGFLLPITGALGRWQGWGRGGVFLFVLLRFVCVRVCVCVCVCVSAWWFVCNSSVMPAFVFQHGALCVCFNTVRPSLCV